MLNRVITLMALLWLSSLDEGFSWDSLSSNLQHSHFSFNEITNKTQSSKKATITTFQFIKMEGEKRGALTLSIHHFHTAVLYYYCRQGSPKLIVEVIGVLLLQLKCHFRTRLNSQHKTQVFPQLHKDEKLIFKHDGARKCGFPPGHQFSVVIKNFELLF